MVAEKRQDFPLSIEEVVRTWRGGVSNGKFPRPPENKNSPVLLLMFDCLP